MVFNLIFTPFRYIIDEDWLKKWKDYVESKSLANPGVSLSLFSFQPVTCKCRNAYGGIKPEIVLISMYILLYQKTFAVSEEVYLKLVSWYGGPHTPLVRYSDYEKGSATPVIIYYPTIMRVYIRENFVLSKMIGEVQMKEYTEYNELKEKVKELYVFY